MTPQSVLDWFDDLRPPTLAQQLAVVNRLLGDAPAEPEVRVVQAPPIIITQCKDCEERKRRRRESIAILGVLPAERLLMEAEALTTKERAVLMERLFEATEKVREGRGYYCV